ncbi:MAG: SH3 domain-containing protein [Clostridia bacterium]|nr:SH3 domain-containing protein [Clostridia bacterium]
MKNQALKLISVLLVFVLAFGVCIVPTSGGYSVSAAGSTSNTIQFCAVLKTSTPLRLTAKASSLIIKVYPKGTSMYVYSTSGSYYYVKIGGKLGYVPVSSVKNGNAVINGQSIVNMRSGAGKSYSVIKKINAGARVSLISYGSEWSKILYDGKRGYVLSSRIKKDAVSTAATVEENVASVNIRSRVYLSASGDSAQLGTLDIGKEVTLLSVSPEWCKIRCGNIVGYIKTKYLRRGNGYSRTTASLRASASSTATVKAKLYTDERLTIVKQGEEWTQVIAAGVKGYVLTKCVGKDKVYSVSEQKNSVYTLTADVKFRTSPGGTLISTLEKGTSVKRISESGGYVKIQYGSKTGYIPSGNMKTGNAYVLANQVPVKTSASKWARTIRTAGYGSRITVLSTENGWSKVLIGTTEGYIEKGLYEKDYKGDTDFNPNRLVFYTKQATSLYKTASSSSGVITSLPKGKVGIRVQKTGNYYRVIANSAVGYVKADDICVGNGIVNASGIDVVTKPAAGSSVVTTVTKGNRVTVLKESGDFYYIRTNGKFGYVNKAHVKKIVKDFTYKAAETCKLVQNTKIYKTSSLSSGALISLPKGKTVSIVKWYNNYARVAYNNYVGYVPIEALKTFTSGKTLCDLNIFSSTIEGRTRLALIPEGANVSIVKDYDNNWMEIRYNGIQGYVLSTYIERTNPSEYTWRYENGYKYAFDASGNKVRDVSDLVSGPYKIVTYKWQCITVVYAKDGPNGGYTIPVKAMICSPGMTTPTGTYYSPSSYRWLQMVDNTWAQWCTDIVGNYLYHTVPDWSYNNFDLEVEEFNHLGDIRSLGCIRLLSSDCKWIYDNTTYGQQIVVTGENASPMEKPENIQIHSWHTWDPTDPTAHYKCTEITCH